MEESVIQLRLVGRKYNCQPDVADVAIDALISWGLAKNNPENANPHSFDIRDAAPLS